MTTDLTSDQPDPEIIDPGAPAGRRAAPAKRRSPWAGMSAALAIVALGILVTRGGEPSPPPTSTPPTSEASEPVVPAASIAGALIDGTPFTVTESEPGLLCAEIDGIETCHREGVSATGPGVVDDALVFGYFPPGSRAATVRYRAIRPSSDGVEIQPDAGFFAIPLQDDDPYRLQYRDDDFDVDREVPLVAFSTGPSQSALDAARDHIPNTIAELGFEARITVLGEWSAFAEGPMVWSLPPAGLPDQPAWSELARLDITGTRIETAFPLPGIRLDTQLVRADSLYFIGEQIAPPGERASDGDESHPVALVRIDRDTDESIVRLFPRPGGLEPSADWPNWQTAPTLGDVDTTKLGFVSDVLHISLLDGTTVLLDGETLELIDQPASA